MTKLEEAETAKSAEIVPLGDVRVIDITQEVAGPTVGRMLGEMGADVIHVEPLAGDNGRNATTEFLGTEGIFHQVSNRGKRSIALDLRTAQGRELMIRLAKSADVLIDGMAPGKMAELGVGYDALAPLNSRLIYGSITGYGEKGPLGGFRGYDPLIQAFAGVVRHNDDGTLQPHGIIYADTGTPLLLLSGILVALLARTKTGRGQLVETSLLQAAVHLNSPNLLRVFNDPDLSGIELTRRRTNPTLAMFATADGTWLSLGAFTNEQFRILCKMLDLLELANDPSLATNLQRAEAAEDISAAVGAVLLTRPADEWVEILTTAGVPCGPVNANPRAILESPQLWENNMLIEVEHPTKGLTHQPAPGVTLSDTPLQVKGPAPFLGAHTSEIMTELGYTEVEIQHLRDKDVVR